MPISTIPEKWLQHASNHYTSRFEIAHDYGTERSLIIGENKMEEKSALVAQLAERRFRNSSLIP